MGEGAQICLTGDCIDRQVTLPSTLSATRQRTMGEVACLTPGPQELPVTSTALEGIGLQNQDTAQLKAPWPREGSSTLTWPDPGLGSCAIIFGLECISRYQDEEQVQVPW